jgi:hypothetical protein
MTWKFRLFLLTLLVLLVVNRGIAQPGTRVSLHDELWNVDINPSTLSTEGRLTNGAAFPVSLGLSGLGQATNLVATADTASWDLPALGMHVTTSMRNGRFFFETVSDKAQKFTWPVITPTKNMRGVILPRGEGFYIPIDDKRCQAFATGEAPFNTMADLSMPLWGIDYGSESLTYILTNPIDNSLAVEQKWDGLALSLTHNFQKNYAAKRYGLMIIPGRASLIEPALLYRKWLIETGQFVSLKEKLQRLPDLEKLFGAPQVYLWADGVMNADDVRNWPALVKELRTPSAPPAKRIASLLPAETQQTLSGSRREEFVSNYTKAQVLEGLNSIIKNRDLYQTELWPLDSLPSSIQRIGREHFAPTRSEADLAKLNSCVLSATFKDVLGDCASFGAGISPKMIQHLQQAGFDRLLLLTPDLDVLSQLPETAADAKRAGYLFGTYDSYHSIHPPGAKNTWATAQFDQKLYDTGRIIKANDQPDRGFQGAGSHLSSIAGEPYLEKRVNQWIGGFGFTAYFIDCDATGELFDNYSTVYPATKQLDMELRLDRLAWITNTYHVVLGSEMGVSFAAPIIHFGHGIMTPVFGWSDPLLRDKSSPYYVGRYYPPNQPENSFKQTILPDKYKDTYYNPEYRIPLYQAAFHDSIITTHHWGTSSIKFTNTLALNELLELLYGVPPLYHLNLDELEERKHEIQTHYAFFSPNYRKLAFSPLSDFTWLTNDHLVQKTEFGADASVVANFSGSAYTYQEHPIPPNSVLLIWKETGETLTYKSQYPPDKLP